jgi:pimeloyl-ACP methyl ester carboxylesterase
MRPGKIEAMRIRTRDFPDLSTLAPQLAGDIAFRRFSTPALSERRSPDQAALSERARFHLRHAKGVRVPTPVGEVQAFVFEPDSVKSRGTVLVVHGWTSEAAFMTAFAEPIRRSGYRVVLFDCPAHGLSPGRMTNLIDCARATLAVGRAFQPIHAVLAHSFGTLVSLLVAEGGRPLPGRLDVGRFVIVAGPNRLSEVTAAFGRTLALTPAGQRAYERHIERVGQRPLAAFSTVALLRTVQRPALVLHARDDADVPFSNALEVAAGCATAELVAFDGLGHRKILYAPPAIRAALAFLAK